MTDKIKPEWIKASRKTFVYYMRGSDWEWQFHVRDRARNAFVQAIKEELPMVYWIAKGIFG